MLKTRIRKGTDSDSRSTANDKGLSFLGAASAGRYPKETARSFPLCYCPETFRLSATQWFRQFFETPFETAFRILSKIEQRLIFALGAQVKPSTAVRKQQGGRP